MGQQESRIEQVAVNAAEQSEEDRLSLTATKGLVDVLNGNAPSG
jgi:hypothetical protein